MKKKKIQVALSLLILSLGLSGCQFKLNKDSKPSGKAIVEYSSEIEVDNNNTIDHLMDISKEDSKKIDYTYLIEDSEYTNTTLAHVIDETTITSDDKFFDHKKGMTTKTFEESAIQPMVVPLAFVLFNVDNMMDLVDAYGTCDINCKKLYTIDGDVLYYFDSTFTFNSFAEKYIGLDIKENDTMNAKILYKLENDNSLTILYRNQTGFRSDSDNVKEMNFNNSKELVVPLENTVFSTLDGKYDEEYLLEAIDVYNGGNNYFHQNNEGKDFSSFKR